MSMLYIAGASLLIGTGTAIDQGRAARNTARDNANAAREQQKKTELEQQQRQMALDNMQKNFAADLTRSNKATVIAGGTADLLLGASDQIKKKQPGGGIASTLGLNI